jgi:DNA-binding transcriptional ArsR family regulator
MGLTHDAKVKLEQAKYGSDWLTFTGLVYGGYRFDLFAFNPKTKEVEITEVDQTSETDSEKIAFATTFAKVNILRYISQKIIPKDFQIFLKGVSNVTRATMLELLYDRGRKRYSDFMVELNLNPLKDAGSFAYHLKVLLNAKLISTDKEGCYVVSPKGEKIVEFCRNLVMTV